ncbi:amino acid racemase [Candidatus Woesearchaeota archaeon]|nr:amino acid racemase [Candidatus Woesearchaeota archaeon]
MKNKTIGVLGGMGPEASAKLYQKMIKYAQDKYGAVQDYEYPPIIIYSLPLEGFEETGIENKELVKKQLIEGVKRLEKAGCELIIIACNSVHYFYEDMQKAVRIPIFNIIEETKKRVKEAGYRKVGLWSAQSTNKLGLYQKKFSKDNIDVISANNSQQKVLNEVIKNVMGGKQGASDVITLKDIARDYTNKGAEAIVMGCTEIPLAIDQTHTDIKLFDTIEIIVQKAVDFSIKGI